MAPQRPPSRFPGPACPDCGRAVPLRNVFLTSTRKTFTCAACGAALRTSTTRAALFLPVAFVVGLLTLLASARFFPLHRSMVVAAWTVAVFPILLALYLV